jgi:hypothetical protein
MLDINDIKKKLQVQVDRGYPWLGVTDHEFTVIKAVAPSWFDQECQILLLEIGVVGHAMGRPITLQRCFCSDPLCDCHFLAD